MWCGQGVAPTDVVTMGLVEGTRVDRGIIADRGIGK